MACGDASCHPVYRETPPQFLSLCELSNVTGTLQMAGHQTVTNYIDQSRNRSDLLPQTRTDVGK